MRDLILKYSLVTTTITLLCLLPLTGHGQEKPPEPEKAAGQEEKKDGPLEVPKSDEEKKALGGKKEEESKYDEIILKDNARIKGFVEDPGGPTIKVRQKLGSAGPVGYPGTPACAPSMSDRGWAPRWQPTQSVLAPSARAPRASS